MRATDSVRGTAIHESMPLDIVEGKVFINRTTLKQFLVTWSLIATAVTVPPENTGTPDRLTDIDAKNGAGSASPQHLHNKRPTSIRTCRTR